MVEVISTYKYKELGDMHKWRTVQKEMHCAVVGWSCRLGEGLKKYVQNIGDIVMCWSVGNRGRCAECV
jgi:hypothetical protein